MGLASMSSRPCRTRLRQKLLQQVRRLVVTCTAGSFCGARPELTHHLGHRADDIKVRTSTILAAAAENVLVQPRSSPHLNQHYNQEDLAQCTYTFDFSLRQESTRENSRQGVEGEHQITHSQIYAHPRLR